MKKKSRSEGGKSGGGARTLRKLCGLLIAVLLAEGMPSKTVVSTYAAQHEETENAQEMYAGKSGDFIAKGFIYTGLVQAAQDSDNKDKNDNEKNDTEDATPTPTKRPKKTPTPVPEDAESEDDGEDNEDSDKDATPTPIKRPKKTPTPVPEDAESEDDGEDNEDSDKDATPTPTKRPKKTPTPVPEDAESEDDGELTGEDNESKEDGELTGEDNEDEESSEDENNESDDNDKNSGDGSEDKNNNDDNEKDDTGEITPMPTKKPKKTPTPTPDGELGEGGEDSTLPSENEGETPEDSEEPSQPPTPTPTKAPAKVWPVNVPTESDDARYQYLLGIDSRVITIDNPPVGYRNATEAAKNMRTITVPVWKMTASGGRYASSMQLTINKKLARNVQEIFKEIYALELKFPIKVLNGFMYRKVGGVALSKSRIMSIHSFGAAIDINPGDYDNDYYLGKGNDLRDKSNPYCIPDEVIAIFEKYGWFWGGNFEICADTMHFQYFELGMLTYQDNWPFRHLKVKNGYMTGADVRNLQQRLRELGFFVSVDGVYGNKTADAITRYQRSRGLEPTGEMDYKTWETIINETHYMSYAF